MVFSFLSLSFCFELHSFTGRAGNTARPSCRLPGRLGRLWASRLLRNGLAVAYSGPSPPPGEKKRNSGSWEKAVGGGGPRGGGPLAAPRRSLPAQQEHPFQWIPLSWGALLRPPGPAVPL